MPSTFSARVISTGKNGKQQVTVRFAGRTVTRHIVNGQGKHPDDAMPAIHLKAEQRLKQARSTVLATEQAITKAEQVLEDPKANVLLKKAAGALLPALRQQLETVNQVLPQAEAALTALRTEHPLTVFYTDERQDGKVAA